MGTSIAISFTPSAFTEEWVFAGPENQPPWIYHDQSTPKGIVHDILRDVISGMGHTSRMHSVPFRRVFAELLSGRAHFSLVIAHGDKDGYPEGLIIGKEPLVGYHVVAVALKSRKLQVDSMDGIRDYHIGHIRLVPQVDKHITDSPKQTMYWNTSDMLKALIRGRVDIAVTAEPSFLEAAKRMGVENQVEVIYTFGRDHMYLVWSHAAFGERVESQMLLADKVLRKMKQHGRVAAIISRYSDLNRFYDYGNAEP